MGEERRGIRESLDSELRSANGIQSVSPVPPPPINPCRTESIYRESIRANPTELTEPRSSSSSRRQHPRIDRPARRRNEPLFRPRVRWSSRPIIIIIINTVITNAMKFSIVPVDFRVPACRAICHQRFLPIFFSPRARARFPHISRSRSAYHESVKNEKTMSFTLI